MTKTALSLFAIFALMFSFFNNEKKTPLGYLPLGDSYTICHELPEKDTWPFILTNHLTEAGIPVTLLGNPSVTGFTTQNLIDKELPLFKKMKPDFTTLLIGVNDWVQGVDSTTFRKNFLYIISEAQSVLSNKKNIVLITIPDFSYTPNGPQYARGRDISKGLEGFNSIIKEEAKKLSLPCVDIFELSKDMKNNPELVHTDGLHPSAKEYALWEKLILEETKNLLKK